MTNSEIQRLSPSDPGPLSASCGSLELATTAQAVLLMVGDCAVTVVHEALGKNNRWCRRQSRLRVQCAAREPAGFPVPNDAEEAGIGRPAAPSRPKAPSSWSCPDAAEVKGGGAPSAGKALASQPTAGSTRSPAVTPRSTLRLETDNAHSIACPPTRDTRNYVPGWSSRAGTSADARRAALRRGLFWRGGQSRAEFF